MSHMSLWAWGRLAGCTQKQLEVSLPSGVLICGAPRNLFDVYVSFSYAFQRIPTCPECAQYREELLLELERIASVLNQPRRQS